MAPMGEEIRRVSGTGRLDLAAGKFRNNGTKFNNFRGKYHQSLFFWGGMTENPEVDYFMFS